ncbi:MAG: cellulase family glycosylhydrolase [Armatimonadota bacterium]
MKLLLAALLLVLLSTTAHALTVATEETGEIVFLEGAQPFGRVVLGAYGPGWQGESQSATEEAVSTRSTAEGRSLSGSFEIPGTSAAVAFSETVESAGPRALRAEYRLTLSAASQPNSIYVSFYLPCDSYAGKSVALSGGPQKAESLMLPTSLREARLAGTSGIDKIAVASGTPVGYEIEFSPPATVLVQDNREWGGGEFEIRVELLGPYLGRSAPAGTQLAQTLTVSFERDITFALDPASAISRTDTSGWFPYTIPWDGAPLDISWLNEKPAGGHGFVTVKGGKLAFEDGTPARFWGVCVSAAANFPTHEQSEAIARRMASFGVNMVRTHHADAGWSDPNFFDESYGDTQHFDADALDRFDYFVYCLKKNGIYVYLDQLVHRKFAAGDGVANAEALDYAAKPETLFDPTLISLQKKFSHNLWTHVNPYTGLAYKDDSAIALMDFTNENDLFVYDLDVEPYASNLEREWREWARAHLVNPDQPIRLADDRGPDARRFLDEVQRRYYAEMHAYLRGVGVRVPITGNTWLGPAANLPSQATMDYMDSHCYWDHPYDDYSRFHNRAQVRVNPADQANNFATLAMSRVLGKPFVCSEWGHPWPNEWRAEGPLATAAVAALQGWDGMLAYTYRHSNETPVDRITGAFNTFNDPAVFGLFPAAALMFRRGDVQASAPPTVVLWGEDLVFGSPQISGWGSSPAYRSLVERTGVATALAPVHSMKPVMGPKEYVATEGATFTASDTGELRRDWKAGVGTVDTPRSQAAYGFLGGAGGIKLRDVRLEIETPFAVVAVSSLDGQPIEHSRHLLVTAVGRVENTGMVLNLTRTELRESGSGPVLCEPVLGTAHIGTRERGFRLYALAPDGERRALGEVEAKDGHLVLPLDGSAGTIYYELAAR